jgi:hypothetical protein
MSMQIIWKRIKNEWFYTRTAIVLFVTSATIVMLGVAFGEFGPRNVTISNSLAAQLCFSLAMVSLAFSTLVVIVGMFRYWSVCDQSGQLMHRIWLVIMIVGLLWLGLGPALYCFAVYLPQTLRNPTSTRDTPTRASSR